MSPCLPIWMAVRTIGELPAQSHCDRVGNFVPAGRHLAVGPYEHGIDMSLRPRKTGSAASLAFGVHCSVFKKRFPDRRAEQRSLRRDTHPYSVRNRPRPRSATRVGGVGVNVPPFRRPRGDPACGATGKTIETASGCQTELPVWTRRRGRAAWYIP